MKEINEIVVENLISLRKSNKLTQLELSEKIGYSDKAISRWEHGETLPDIITLSKLAEIYGVNVTAFFDEKLNVVKEKMKFTQPGNKLTISLLSIASMWTLIVLLFVTLNTVYDYNAWQLFILGIPLTFLLAIIFNSVWGNRKLTVLFNSIFLWTLLTYIHIQFIEYGLWMVYLLGIPVQIIIVLASQLKSKKR